MNESFHPYGRRENPATWQDPISNSDLSTIAGITPQGYTFKDTLLYTNYTLVNLGGRVEDAFTGRFLAADPNIPDPSDPQSYNRYSYVRNNPVTYTDPTGFCDANTTCTQSSQSLDNENPGGWSDGGLAASFYGFSCTGNGFTTEWVGEQISIGSTTGPINYFPVLVPVGQPGGPGFYVPMGSSGVGSAFGSSGASFGSRGSAGSLAPPIANDPTAGLPISEGLPTVYVTATRLPSVFSSFVYNEFIDPMFGWAHCAGYQCSNGELGWRFVRGPLTVAATVYGGKAAGMVLSKVGATLANAQARTGVAASAVLFLSAYPEAAVNLAKALDVAGAEQIEQSMQLEAAEKLIAESESVLNNIAQHGGE